MIKNWPIHPRKTPRQQHIMSANCNGLVMSNIQLVDTYVNGGKSKGEIRRIRERNILGVEKQKFTNWQSWHSDTRDYWRVVCKWHPFVRNKNLKLFLSSQKRQAYGLRKPAINNFHCLKRIYSLVKITTKF